MNGRIVGLIGLAIACALVALVRGHAADSAISMVPSAPAGGASSSFASKAADTTAGWVSLGPAGAKSARSYPGLAPTWPTDHAILAVEQGWLARSDDDGASWRRLPMRGRDLRGIWPAPGFDQTGIALVLYVQENNSTPTLFRTPDGGTTWQPVLDRSGGTLNASDSEVVYSPAFQTDGLALLRSGGGLLRSVDAGRTWQQLTLSPVADGQTLGGRRDGSQSVQTVRFSPDYTADSTIFVTLTRARDVFPLPFDTSKPEPPPTVHKTSLGMVVSRDRGQTWQPASSGLELDAVPARFIQDVALSPTFGQDQTLLAWAWGAPSTVTISGEDRLHFANGLFRSTDAGRTWKLVWDRPTTATDAVVAGFQHVRMALSPTFATDHLILAALDRPQVTRSPERADKSAMLDLLARCDLARTDDGGASWAQIRTAGAEPVHRPCGDLTIVDAPHGRLTVFDVRRGAFPNWTKSPDLGASWTTLGTPPGFHDGPKLRGVRPDGVLLFAATDGIWAYGGGLTPTTGAVSCSVSPGSALMPFFTSGNGVGDLGCASEDAHTVQVRERASSLVRAIWLEDDSPEWLLLQQARLTDRSGAWEWRSKASEPWTGPPDRVVEAVVQRFWGGILILAPRPDGKAEWLEVREPWGSVAERQWNTQFDPARSTR
jgi:photosystem II stability/assembly factor-like uncharacterized protein